MSERFGQYQQWIEPHLDEIENLIAAGYTEAGVARMFGVSPRAFSEYKKSHTALLARIQDGKRRGVAEVAQAIFKRAKGYEIKESQVNQLRDATGKRIIRLEVRETNRHIPPDIRAATYWLSKVDPKHWGEASSVTLSEAQVLTNDLYSMREEHNGSAIRTGREFEKRGVSIPETLKMEIRAELETQGVDLHAMPNLQVFLEDGTGVSLAECDQ